MTTTPTTDSCANCRYASKSKRPRITEATGFGDQLEFADDDEVVYTCQAFVEVGPFRQKMTPRAGTEIGPVPIPRAVSLMTTSTALEVSSECSAWAAPRELSAEQRAELDRLERRAAMRGGDPRPPNSRVSSSSQGPDAVITYTVELDIPVGRIDPVEEC